MANRREESALDRARRILVYVEEMIALVSEHPECELKREWRRDTPYHKAEFVKDFQSIANSSIPEDREKYIVVGADEPTRTITGCSHADYDEAGMRQLLETYLDPVPEFEILRLTSSEGQDFVIVRIPHQPNRPFVAKAAIRDNNKTYLEEGEIWVKPGGENTGSTGKRRVRTRTEVLSLIDIEPRVQQAVAARMEQLVPQIRLEERTRIHGSTFSSISTFTATDEEFESYVEQLLSEN
ncbi:MAG: putative DNA binding domain-containing protein, partial [Chloroflexota bacterium]|nr:putative DNA binding domain-containing protein [Chloroflexota bacterium]